MYMKKVITIIFSVAMVLVFAVYFYPANPALAPVIVPENGTPDILTLPVGRTGTIGDISVTFNELVADYRCPVDVTCIQAGAVVANITISSLDKTETFNLPQDEVPRSFGKYLVSIESAKPEARSTVRINPGEYVVTFKVVKK